ncbi:hypothetical protein CC2G_013483 [Coprinopsis cinerea AmutBmut pab1-1]|nr:hypothetical protein CC2G_013483 [Coprinopsis cinerea AmutBmut pab1-1]
MPKAPEPMYTSRQHVPYQGGVGIAYTSPVKKRNRRKEKTAAKPFGSGGVKQALLDALDFLDEQEDAMDGEGNSVAERPSSPGGFSMACDHCPDSDISPFFGDDDCVGEAVTEETYLLDSEQLMPPFDADESHADDAASTIPANHDAPTARSEVTEAATATATARLHSNWAATLPTLQEPYLHFKAQQYGKPVPPLATSIGFQCQNPPGQCVYSSNEVQVLKLDGFWNITALSCKCDSLCKVLIRNGFFPSSPAVPRLAVAIPLLDFYRSLFEESCDAVTAFSEACRKYYKRRGFHHRNSHGQDHNDAWRRSLTQAIQWYDNLLVMIAKAVDEALQSADRTLFPSLQPASLEGIPIVPQVLTTVLQAPPEDLSSNSQPTDPDPPPSATPSALQTENPPATTNPPKKPRGRPRKNAPKAQTAAVETTKKKRGRPPKNAAKPTRNSSTNQPANETTAPRKRRVRVELKEDFEDAQERMLRDARVECDWVLQQRCPACFSSKTFGNKANEGASNIQVCLDGNFSHRHIRRDTDHQRQHFPPEYYLPKAYVDKVGNHIDLVRDNQPKARDPKVPDEAVDECEDGHIAGKGTNVKTSTQMYDDTGTMALVCRHDVPLFLANIDTPGEQQKYGVALVKKLYSLLPKDATVDVFYDVACVLDRSLETYDILPEALTSRLCLITSAMHSYAHQWSCQLYYNPRLRKFTGLTDGEGVERFWAKHRRVIPLMRVSGREKRLQLIDRHTAAIGAQARDGLGAWIKARAKVVEKFRVEATAELRACGVPVSELRELWADQQKAGQSIRTLRPSKLKKDMDVILVLQSDLDRIEGRIEEVVNGLDDEFPEEHKQGLLTALNAAHTALKDRIEATYMAINVGDAHPDLQGLDYEFVKALLLLRDLKINIRRRAIAQFFEREKLQQPSQGRANPLGTNLHQLTRKAIAKRQPALQSAIRRFNTQLVNLKKLNKPEYNIPMPRELPTDLDELRDHSDIMEDVWTTHSPLPVPKWFSSPEVRKGIRAMLKLDRCQEEVHRLGMEADNLCRWYGRQLADIEFALTQPAGQRVGLELVIYRDHLYSLKASWANAFASMVRFDAQIAASKVVAPADAPATLRWITPTVSAFEPATHHDPLPPPDHDPALDATPILDDEEIYGGYEPPRKLSKPKYTYAWATPPGMLRDDDMFDLLGSLPASIPDTEHCTRQTGARFGVRNGLIEVSSATLELMASPSAALDDDSVNTAGALLQHIFAEPTMASAGYSSICAVFSSFDLLAVRSQCSLLYTWDQTHHTEYWRKQVWILPIHRQDHWVVCAIYPSHRRIILFDSLAAKASWEIDIPVLYPLTLPGNG